MHKLTWNALLQVVYDACESPYQQRRCEIHGETHRVALLLPHCLCAQRWRRVHCESRNPLNSCISALCIAECSETLYFRVWIRKLHCIFFLRWVVAYDAAGKQVFFMFYVNKVTPSSTEFTFRTERKEPRLGVMLVGWGGNNGTTVTAAVLANKLGLTWKTKTGVKVQRLRFEQSVSML